MSADVLLKGERYELAADDSLYPQALALIARPPRKLFVVGDPLVLREGLAVIGARKATPYGRGCARRFASIAAERGIVIISGGARGCDAAAHEAALEVGGKTVVFLGGVATGSIPASTKVCFSVWSMRVGRWFRNSRGNATLVRICSGSEIVLSRDLRGRRLSSKPGFLRVLFRRLTRLWRQIVMFW